MRLFVEPIDTTVAGGVDAPNLNLKRPTRDLLYIRLYVSTITLIMFAISQRSFCISMAASERPAAGWMLYHAARHSKSTPLFLFRNDSAQTKNFQPLDGTVSECAAGFRT